MTHDYSQNLGPLEVVALDLYFGGAFYTASIACDDSLITYQGIDVTNWSRVVSNNFGAFEDQVEAYFRFPADLNQAPFESITIQGVSFWTSPDA